VEYQVISKKDLKDWIYGLCKDYIIFAPVKGEEGIVFNEIKSIDEIYFKSTNSKKSPKGICFPQMEKLFSFSKEDKIELFPIEVKIKKRIIFGIRPCDAMAFSALDKVFISQEYKDTYYIGKRENTLMIGIACTEPETICFCTTIGGDPASKEGIDVLLIDIGDEYFVEVLTNKGKSLVNGISYFKKANDNHIKLKEEKINKAREKVKYIDITGLKEKLDESFDLPFWDRIYEKCIGCGICTFLCPTCHCFDIVDEGGKDQGERIRIWDSCQFPLFTKHASGVNPRPTGKERLRQRILHKFKYFVENYNMFGCVGCGRCVKYCPVNLDIREILKSLAGNGEIK